MKRTIVDVERLGLPTATLINSFLKEGFIANYITGCFTSLTQEEVQEALVNTLGELEDTTVSGDTIFMKSERGVVTGTIYPYTDHSIVDLTFIAEPAVKMEFQNILNMNRYHRVREDNVYDIDISYHYLDTEGVQRYRKHNRTTEDFTEIRDDFYSSINVPLLMSMYAESKESNLILTGEPGTGKTCFVKKCLRELALTTENDIRVAYVKDHNILKSGAFWANLEYDAPDVLVLDDLDDELHPRTEGRNEIVNHMLSFSDGLFDTSTKILITTNQPNTRIDKALIRPGRCFDILKLPKLTNAQARTIWIEGFEVTDASFTDIFGDVEATTVSQAALMSEYHRFLKDTTSAGYLIDPTISIRKVVEITEDINEMMSNR